MWKKTPYVLLYIKRIILTSLKLGEVAVRLPASVGLLGWYGWLAWAVGLPTIIWHQREFRREMHIASKYGCLFEPKAS
ncbi:hypothetical protein CLOL250_02004 [Clostridium sp. L2-50]|nr:hypothetical protein CLOL250_02004 [Clostridium sp. L2-50]